MMPLPPLKYQVVLQCRKSKLQTATCSDLSYYHPSGRSTPRHLLLSMVRHVASRAPRPVVQPPLTPPHRLFHHLHPAPPPSPLKPLWWLTPTSLRHYPPPPLLRLHPTRTPRINPPYLTFHIPGVILSLEACLDRFHGCITCASSTPSTTRSLRKGDGLLRDGLATRPSALLQGSSLLSRSSKSYQI